MPARNHSSGATSSRTGCRAERDLLQPRNSPLVAQNTSSRGRRGARRSSSAARVLPMHRQVEEVGSEGGIEGEAILGELDGGGALGDEVSFGGGGSAEVKDSESKTVTSKKNPTGRGKRKDASQLPQLAKLHYFCPTSGKALYHTPPAGTDRNGRPLLTPAAAARAIRNKSWTFYFHYRLLTSSEIG